MLSERASLCLHRNNKVLLKILLTAVVASSLLCTDFTETKGVDELVKDPDNLSQAATGMHKLRHPEDCFS